MVLQLTCAITVHKDSLLVHVCVQIQAEVNLFAQDHLQKERLYRKDLRLLLPRRARVESVKIFALAVASEVAVDHAVRVDDRNDVEDKVLKEYFSL